MAVLGDNLESIPTETPGVYCLYDLDGEPAYAGKSNKLRSRLRQHLVRQDSSVASYGRLDIWDLSHCEWWHTEAYDSAEAHLLAAQRPYLNFATDVEPLAGDTPIDTDDPDGTVHLIDAAERDFRSQPYNRTKQKLDHLSRMVDTIKLAGHSDETKRTLYEHDRILQENMAAFPVSIGRPCRRHDVIVKNDRRR